MIENIIISMQYVVVIGAFIIYMLYVPQFLHIIQLESYHNKDYFNWIIKNWKRAFKYGAYQLLIFALCFFGTYFFVKHVEIAPTLYYFLAIESILSLAFIIPNIIVLIKAKKERKTAKKPLKYTARVKRLFFSNFIILMLLRALFMDYLGTSFESTLLIYSFLIFTLPLNMLISNFFIEPTETVINNHYINSARRKLHKKEYKDLIKIGITGSYGKTSTKFILKTILSERYDVLATPESYNTSMGNVRVIREQLKPEHQVFISEMGARNRWDIKEICDFVEPQIGIITSIGPQHLETFKSIENVAKTKKELIDSLPQDGIVVLPSDNKYCYDIYKEEKRKKYLYGMKENADVYAYNIKLSSEGSTFTIATKNEKFTCTTKLLGEHNIENILGCVAVAIELGLTADEIQRGISKIESIPHRLQILPSNNGTIVIDDAFNANPVGSKRALDILKQFEGRKIIITPGMVELGNKEYELNKEFGRQMADSVDIAILVGIKQAKPIEEGLKEKKFDENNLYVVSNLNEAVERLGKLTQVGDVVLFENDLPDNY